MFRKLFTPIRIGSMEVRNRISMPAFGLLYSTDRKCGERLINFYEARARGGCGLIIVGGVGIDELGSGFALPSIMSDEYIPGWRNLAQACHKHGAKVMLQLFHAGRYTHSMMIGGKKAVAPSAVASRYTHEEPRALLIEEIHQIQESFAAAAARAQEAGVDGVEIIASAGYLISQFLSPVTNLRHDEYGGSFENRVRFGREVVEKTRARVGRDFVVTMRVAGNDFVPGSNTNAESAAACQVFEQAGVDAFNVTGGWHETYVPQLPMMVPRGAYTYLALGIKRAVRVPIIASNRIVTPEQAEQVLRDGFADMVNIGRAQIADPEWARKAQEGRSHLIRPCVGCLQGCMDRLFSGKPVSCLCNPQAGLELERQVTPAAVKKKVVVVGGGPGGLEAACTAAQRGHAVTLYEAAPRLGGQLHLVAAPPGREEFASLLSYYEALVKELKVKVKLGKRASAATIKREKPDAVVVATGAEPLVPSIPGVDLPHVFTAWDVLAEKAELGRKVAVIGGGAVGVETALFIAAKGTISGETLKFLLFHEAESIETLKQLITRGAYNVTILEMLPKLGQDIGPTSRWVMMKSLTALGVSSITGAKVTSIREREVVFTKDAAEQTIPADTVVLALGAKAVDGLAEKLEQAGLSVYKVGDCLSPRKVMDAVHEGFLAGLKI